MKRAKGQPEQQQRRAGRRIQIEEFSTQRWSLPLKVQPRMGDSIEHSRVLGLYPTPAASREMNLRVLTARVYEKLAA